MVSFRKIFALLVSALLAGAVPLLGSQGTAQASLAVAYSQYLWPAPSGGGIPTVYYIIDPASDPNATPKIQQAINTFNADFMGVIQWVPWTSSDGTYYVDINLSTDNASGECEANEGFENIAAQPMGGSTNCTVGTILHEMGHVIGLWHEMVRTDRANYVTVSYPNVIKGSWSNFQILTDNEQILGPYDYASVMQYPPYSFTANGLAVIETIPAGMPMSSYEGVPSLAGASGMPAEPPFDYSAGDKETILRLYGAAPKDVTVTSNPVGLSVVVDGVTVTTPQVFAWPLYSTHTLNVASEVQSLPGYIVNSSSVAATFYYTFGRWNIGAAQAQSQTITVTPGTGSPVFPSTAPQIATYSANFTQLVPYTPVSVYPTATGTPGTATIAPMPQTYFGGTQQFFVARQKATLTATANTGWSFYEFNNGPFWLQGGLGLNPKGFDVPDSGNPVDPVAEFSDGPVYTVTVTPETFSSGLYLYVDINTPSSTFIESPHNFSVGNGTDPYTNYDPAWTAGQQHTLTFPTPEYPYSSNSRYALSSWSKNVPGGNGGTITVPAAKATYTATVTPQFAPATNFGYPPCGGTGVITPASPTNDGFYPTGTLLTYTATAGSGGWEFGGWSNDITGSVNPATLTPTGETLVFANFNIVDTPLTLTSIKPATEKAGGKGFVMTLTGTGFSPASNVSVNGFNEYLPITYVSPTTLKVTVPASYLTTPGGYQVFVENYPAMWKGCAVFGFQTFLVAGKGPPVATPAFSPKPKTYTNSVSVTITDAVAGAMIFYTTDGSNPATSPTATMYTTPIPLTATTTVKADATATGYVRSAVASGKYTITP